MPCAPCTSLAFIPCKGKASFIAAGFWGTESKLGMGRGGDGCREPSSKMDCIGRVDDCIFVRPLRAPSCPFGSGDLCALFGFFLSSWFDGSGDF